MTCLSRLACLALALLAPLPPLLTQAQPALPPEVKQMLDIPYVPNAHANQKLDLFVPPNPRGPLVVFIHGGGWVGGSKKDFDPTGLLGTGTCVARIEYRFSQHALFPAQIEDCKAAIRWLRAHAAEYGYDPKRIGATGSSAGGHLVALLATTGNVKDFDVGENLDQSSAIQCGIDFFGPTDFPGWKAPTDNPDVQRSGPSSLVVKLLGGSIDEKPELARKASPITWVTKETAPLLILHGTNDPLVGLNQSERLVEKMKAAGVEVTLDVIQGAGHGSADFFTPERVKAMVEFLARHLAAK